jgi:hypothetical protein
MTDATDNLIAALVVAREHGTSVAECCELVADVYAAPWDEKDSVVDEREHLLPRHRFVPNKQRESTLT